MAFESRQYARRAAWGRDGMSLAVEGTLESGSPRRPSQDSSKMTEKNAAAPRPAAKRTAEE